MMHLSLIFLTFLGVVKIDAQYVDWDRTQVYIYKKGFEIPGWYTDDTYTPLHQMMEEGEEQWVCKYLNIGRIIKCLTHKQSDNKPLWHIYGWYKPIIA